MNHKLVFMLLLLFTQPVWAVKPESGYTLTRESEEESPKGDIVIEHYANDNITSGSFQEWLSEKANRENRVLLFQHDHNVSIVFSPDESQLIINNTTGSTETIIHLFKKREGLHYEAIKKPDLNFLLWHYFMQVNSPKLFLDNKTVTYYDITPFDHNDIECLQWSADNQSILVKMDGHLNSQNHINNSWLCVLNLKTMKPSFDLEIMNHKSVTLDGKIRGDSDLKTEGALINTRWVPHEFRRAYEFLEFIKMPKEPQGVFNPQDAPDWDLSKLLSYLSPDGVTFTDVNGNGLKGHYSLEIINNQLSSRNGKIFKLFSHLSHTYSTPYRQYSKLTFEKTNDDYVVNIGDAGYKLTFRSHNGKLYLTKCDYQCLEGD